MLHCRHSFFSTPAKFGKIWKIFRCQGESQRANHRDHISQHVNVCEWNMAEALMED